MIDPLVTGISRGLGKARAQAALACGDTVVGTVRGNIAGIEPPQAKLRVLNPEIGDPHAVQNGVPEAFERLARLDSLVTDAGYGVLGRTQRVTEAERTRRPEINVFGPFRPARSARPRLCAKACGRIGNTAPMAGPSVHAAATSAIKGLFAARLQEAQPAGLKVAAVAPGASRPDFLSDQLTRRGDLCSAAHAAAAGPALDDPGKPAGRQIDDPARAARAILTIDDAPAPPLHLLPGPDGPGSPPEKPDSVIGETDRSQAATCNAHVNQ